MAQLTSKTGAPFGHLCRKLVWWNHAKQSKTNGKKQKVGIKDRVNWLNIKMNRKWIKIETWDKINNIWAVFYLWNEVVSRFVWVIDRGAHVVCLFPQLYNFKRRETNEKLNVKQKRYLLLLHLRLQQLLRKPAYPTKTINQSINRLWDLQLNTKLKSFRGGWKVALSYVEYPR